LAIREKLAAAHPNEMRDQIALAESLSGNVTREGSWANNKAILAELRHNSQRLEALLAAHPDFPEIRRSLASLYGHLAAYLTNEDDYELSLSAYRRGQQVLEGMTTAPTDRDRLQLCRSHLAIGYALGNLGRRIEAISSCRKAVELAERFVAENSNINIYKLYLGMSLHILGDLQREEGYLSEAAEALRRSRTILEAITKSNPTLSFKYELASVSASLGRLEGAVGRPAEAAEMLRPAVADLEEVVVRANNGLGDPVIYSFVRKFAEACDALVEVRGPMESLLRARATFERLDREGRLRPITRHVFVWLDIRIAKAQRQAGRLGDARETIRRIESELEIVREGVPPSLHPYCEARARALLSTLIGRPGSDPAPAERVEIRRQQDRAIDGLRRALAAGFERGRLMGDHDLDALRARPDFQALLIDVAFPADPFAR
jgi:tetratricopeptide (TPR) repeat protein